MKIKDYEVKIILNLTAENKKKALDYAVSDIKELYSNGTLEAEIKEFD